MDLWWSQQIEVEIKTGKNKTLKIERTVHIQYEIFINISPWDRHIHYLSIHNKYVCLIFNQFNQLIWFPILINISYLFLQKE